MPRRGAVAVPDPLLAADPGYGRADLVLASLTLLDENGLRDQSSGPVATTSRESSDYSAAAAVRHDVGNCMEAIGGQMRRRDGYAMRHRGRRVIAGTAFGAILATLSIAGFVLYLQHEGHTIDMLALATMFIALLGTLIALAQLIVALAPPPGSVSPAAQLEHAMQALAEAVLVQWERETVVRSLRSPPPIQVRWAAAPREVQAASSGTTEQRSGRRSKGTLGDITQKYLQLPGRQLFIIGVPGSGKTATAILFVLSLLRQREDLGAVPVLLSPVGWDPENRSFQAWIGDEILVNYPALGEAASYGEQAVSHLVASGRILPVIDGLDEISEPLRTGALKGIATEWGNRPIVLTCRTEEFEALAQAGRSLTGTTVYLMPVSQAERVAYLTQDSDASASARWQPLLEYMKRNPVGDLAKALSTPLMMNLVYAVYSSRDDVAELTDSQKFPDRESIEGHLLDSFIDIVYSASPMPPILGTPRRPGRPRQSSAKARAWLAEIARSLDRIRTRDIAWWLTYRCIPWQRARLAFVATITTIGALASFLIADIVYPITTTLFVTLVIGVASLGAALVGAFLGSIPGKPVRAAARIRIDAERLAHVAPFILGALPGIPVGVLVSFAIGPISGAYCGVVTAVLGSVLGGLGRWSLPADNAVAISPRSSIAHDRGATLFHLAAVGIAIGTAVGVAVSAHHGPALGAYCAIISGLASGIVVSAGSAYAWFVPARLWLALTGRLPLRLMGFLDDAYQRGLLRQNGAVYQFRHVRLQERLVLSPQHPAHVQRTTAVSRPIRVLSELPSARAEPFGTSRTPPA